MEVIWRPSDEVRERTNAMRLARRLDFDDYWELVRFSAEEPERFWPEAIADMGLEFSRPWEQVVDLSRGPTPARLPRRPGMAKKRPLGRLGGR